MENLKESPSDVAGASMHPIVRQPMPFQPYYESGGITIYLGDCKKILPWIQPVDLLLTDPPYGIGEARKKNVNRSNTTKFAGRNSFVMSKDYGTSDWDDAPPPDWFIESAKESAKTQILWGGNYYGLPASSCWLVWDKDNGENDFADCELAWTNMPKAVRKFRWKWHGMLQEQMGDKKEHRVHPTQKPTALMRWCLSLVPEAKTVLDPFMGSGTTLVASKLEGRQAIGIEINEAYCEAAAKRLSQGTLF
jgi:DNA modification methylase